MTDLSGRLSTDDEAIAKYFKITPELVRRLKSSGAVTYQDIYDMCVVDRVTDNGLTHTTEKKRTAKKPTKTKSPFGRKYF